MRYMRMALGLDQKQLGEKFGIPQQAVAKLELGQIKVARQPIPLAKIYSVFGCATHHILFNFDSDQFNYSEILKAYWKLKDRTKGDRSTVRLTRRQYHDNLRRSEYRRLKERGKLT